MSNIDVQTLHEMILYGAKVLNSKKFEINDLNVFPVPDGDTGYNMNMTASEGVNMISSSSYDNVADLTRDFSKGLLRGARGNSGVILSQYYRGFAEGLENCKQLDSKHLQKALKQGSKRAYASVIKAVEGTILTVCREMQENAEYDKDIVKYLENVYEAGKKSLDNTPNLLPALKEAGVVDSGGAGFLYIIQGMLARLKNIELDLEVEENIEFNDEHSIDPDDITFKYCTEMLIKIKDEDKFSLDNTKAFLEDNGDSIVAIQDEDILKVHVHTNEPNVVFSHGLEIGEFVNVKSENMMIQALEAQEKRNKTKKELAIISVSPSKEFSELFNSFVPVEIIEGGQTLNPSVEDIKNAIKRVNAKNVIVLPNNSNIILAAESAKEQIDDVNIEIIKTKHLTQAVELLQTYNEDLDFETSVKNLNDNLEHIDNIEITKAIKTVTLQGVNIKEGDFLVINNGKISNSNPDIDSMLKTIFDNYIENDSDLITVLIGEDGDEELINKFIDYINDESPFTEVQVFNTNQPVYNYLISGIL